MLPSLLLIASACVPSPQAAPSVEEIFKKVREAIPKSPRYAADFEEVRTLDAPGIRYTVKTTGRVYVGGNRLLRLEGEARSNPPPPGRPEKETHTVVADGEYLWMDPPALPSGKRLIFRGRLEDVERQGAAGGMTEASSDPSKAIDQLLAQYSFTYRGEEVLDGRKVWVLEGVPRPDAPEDQDPMAEMLRARLKSVLVKIGKEDGWVYHFEMRGAADAPPLMLKRYWNLRWNPELDPALFRFTVPAGAEIQDMAAEAPASRSGGGR